MTAGLLLAAGAGRRAGGPKALRRHPDGTPWLVRAAQVLIAGGCEPVVVVLGAGSAEGARLLQAQPVDLVVVLDWAEGLSRSLRAGLTAVPAGTDVLVHLVDLPDVGSAVVRRVLAAAGGPDDLTRAVYDGRPGHPVVLGADHVPAVLEGLGGDRGAGAYLSGRAVILVECGDLASGADRDE